MTKEVDYETGTVVEAEWLDALQETLTGLALNFRLEQQSSTAVRVVGAAGNSQSSIVINGKMRYETSTNSLTISGGAGTKDVYATADTADRNYALEFGASGYTPAGTNYRKIGEVVWDGAAITAVYNMAQGAPTHNPTFTGTIGLPSGSIATAAVADGAITLGKINTALKPSGTAAAGDEALRALGATASTACAGNDTRIPTQGENDALVGSAGTPSTSNPFLTEDDTGVMHTDKARTITAVHTFTQAPRHGVSAHTADSDIILSAGKVHTFAGAAGQTMILPPAPTVGDEVELLNIDTTDSVTIARGNGSHTINGLSASFVLAAGFTAKLTYVATNAWIATLATFNRAPIHGVQSFSGAGTISATDGQMVVISGAGAPFTLALPDAVAGLAFTIFNTSAYHVTLDGDGSDTIDGNTSINIAPGHGIVIVGWTASLWLAFPFTDFGSSNGQHKFYTAPLHAAQAFTASGNILATAGKFITFNGSSGQTLTLPAAVVGMEFVVANLDLVDTVDVARAGSDVINNALTSQTLSANSRTAFACVSAGQWVTY